jgi:hypothetical protein
MRETWIRADGVGKRKRNASLCIKTSGIQSCAGDSLTSKRRVKACATDSAVRKQRDKDKFLPVADYIRQTRGRFQ